jgi:hypothetical protein
LALVAGLALGSGIAVMLELTRIRRRDETEDDLGNAIDEAVKRSVRSHLREIQVRDIQAAE